MAKQRVVKTSFWSDQYIETLPSMIRYLFLYLLTNESANLIGIYELSIKRMVFETGLSETDVDEALKKLEKDEKVFYLDNRVVFKNYLRHQSMNPSVVQGMLRERELLPTKLIERIESDDRLSTARYTLLNLTLPNSTQPKGSTELFEKFWIAYPRKEAKGNAEKSFIKSLEKTDIEKILTGVENYIVRIRKEKIEKQFIKLPATWLNQECWNDESKVKIPSAPPPRVEEDPPPPLSELTPEQKKARMDAIAKTRANLHAKIT